MSTKRRTPAFSAASMTFQVPSTMTRSKSSGLPAMIETRCTTASQPSAAARTLSASVTSPTARSQPRDSSDARPCPVAHETADRELTTAQGRHDTAPDEARRARDEDHPVSASAKFCQYRLGVGPVWPLYFEPSPLAP